MKKVKILTYCGAYTPDQVVEVEDKVAEALCYVNHMEDGRVVRRAMLLEEFEAIPEPTIEESYVGDGKKNVVESKPYDPVKGFQEKDKEPEKKAVKSKG